MYGVSVDDSMVSQASGIQISFSYVIIITVIVISFFFVFLFPFLHLGGLSR